MKNKKMRIGSVYCMILLLALVKTASAQVMRKNSFSASQTVVIDPLASIEKLRPVIRNAGETQNGSNETSHQFGLDINKIKTTVPGLMRTETIWHEKGKNNLTGSNREVVDFGQLVPLLIGALQEQVGQYEALKKEVEMLKLQLRSKGEEAEAIKVDAGGKRDVETVARNASY